MTVQSSSFSSNFTSQQEVPTESREEDSSVHVPGCDSYLQFMAGVSVFHHRASEELLSQLVSIVPRSNARSLSCRKFLRLQYAHDVAATEYVDSQETFDSLITPRSYNFNKMLAERQPAIRGAPWMRALYSSFVKSSIAIAMATTVSRLTSTTELSQDSLLVLNAMILSRRGTFSESFNVDNVPESFRPAIHMLRCRVDRCLNMAMFQLQICDCLHDDVFATFENFIRSSERYFAWNMARPQPVVLQAKDLLVPSTSDSDSESEFDDTESWSERMNRYAMEFVDDKDELCSIPELPGDFPEGEMPKISQFYPGVLALMRNLSGKAKEVWNVPTRISEAASNIADTFSGDGKMVEAIGKVQAVLEQAGETFKNQVDDLTSGNFIKRNFFDAFMKYIMPIICIVSGVYMKKHVLVEVCFWMSAVSLLIYWGMKANVFLKLWNLFHGVQDQAGPKFPWAQDIINVLRPFLNFRVGCFEEEKSVASAFTKLFTKEGEQGSWLHDLSVLPTIMEKVTEFWKSLKRLFGWAKDDYKNFVTGYEDVDSFVKEAMTILTQREVEPSSRNIEVVKTLFNMTGALRHKYSKDNDVMAVLRDFYPKIEKIHLEFSKYATSGAFQRHEPVGYLLRGDPGVGKSTANGIICDRLVRYRIGDNEDLMSAYRNNPSDYRFNRIQSPYFEGVKPGTISVEYPDFGACKQDGSSAVQHEAELINLISNEYYTPNMAFESKGKLKIAPDFISGTTNNTGVTGDSARHKLAVARRLHVFYVKWRGQGKMAAEGAELDTSLWEFYLQRVTDSFDWVMDTTVPPMNLDEVTEYLCRAYELKKRAFASRQAIIENDKFSLKDLKEKIAATKIVPGTQIWEYVKPTPPPMVEVDLTDAVDCPGLLDDGIHVQAKLSARMTKLADMSITKEANAPGGYKAFLWNDTDNCIYDECDFRETEAPNHRLFNRINNECVDAGTLAVKLTGTEDRRHKPFLNENYDWNPHYFGEIPLTARTMIREAFKCSPMSFGELLWPEEDNPSARFLRFAMVSDLYSYHEVSFKLKDFEKMYEKHPLLSLWCLCNVLDTEAWKLFTSHVWEDVPTMEKVKGYVSLLANEAKCVLLPIAKEIMTALAIMGTSIGVVALASKLFLPSTGKPKPIKGTAQDQASAYFDQRALSQRQRKDRKTIKFDLRPRTVEKHSNEQVSVCLARTMIHQWQLVDFNNEVITNVIALGDRDFLMNGHVWDIIRNNTPEGMEKQAFLTLRRGDMAFQLNSAELLSGIVLKEFDTYWVKLPSMPQCPDIMPHWVPDHYVEDMIHDGNLYFSSGCNIFGKGYGSSRTNLIGGRTVGDRYVAQLFSTRFNSHRGDCGTLLYGLSNDAGKGKFMGILQSGEEGDGLTYFCAIPRVMVVQMRARLSGYEPKERSDGKKIVIGTSSTPHNFQTVVNDILTPSEYPAKEPTKTNVEVNKQEVYDLARKKYCPGFEPSQENLDLLGICIEENLKRWHECEGVPMKAGMLSLEEAVVGFPQSYIRGIPLNTSPGAPFNAVLKLSKNELLGEWKNGEFVKGPYWKEFEFRVGCQFEQLLQGEIPIDVFTDVVKSEILPIPKVKKGKGRIVSACGVVRTAVSRMIWGRFWEWIFANHLTNGISAGDNMQGMDADVIVRRHIAVTGGEDLHCTGDLSANDARQTKEVLVLALNKIAKFMKENDRTTSVQDLLMSVHAKSYLHQFHIRGDTIDMWDGSLSSGDPNTTGLNSVTNPAYARYSVWKSFEFRLENFHEKYNKSVIDSIMGDDNWFSVSPEWKDHMSEQIMASGYADFGHVYTNDAKDGLNEILRSVTDISYLKRTPRYEPVVGRWLMALDLDTILEIPLWTHAIGKDKVADMEQALQNADTMTRELCFHGDEVWAEWIPRYKKMFSEQQWRPKYATRREMLHYVLGSIPVQMRGI